MANNPFTDELERRAGGNPFTAELMRRKAGGTQPAQQRRDPTDVAIESGFNRFIDNLIGVGNVAVTAGARALMGQPLIERAPSEADATPALRGELPRLPKVGAQVLPSRHELEAGLQVAAGTPGLLMRGEGSQALDVGGRYAEELERQQQHEAQTREQHPVATAVGDVGGDIATLLTGRAPVANLVRQAEKKLLPPAGEMFFSGRTAQVVKPGFEKTLERAWQSRGWRQLARGLGRSAEAGLEASALEIIKGDDPLEAAAFAAGGQASGSLILEAGKGLFAGGPLKAGMKIGAAAFSAGAIWQLTKSATPGGRDRILESMEAGFDKVKWALALGTVAGLSGAPRYSDSRLAAELPQLVDALAAVPRAAVLSVITDMVGADDDTQARYERTLESLARDPGYTGEDKAERELVKRLKEAFESEGDDQDRDE